MFLQRDYRAQKNRYCFSKMYLFFVVIGAMSGVVVEGVVRLVGSVGRFERSGWFDLFIDVIETVSGAVVKWVLRTIVLLGRFERLRTFRLFPRIIN